MPDVEIKFYFGVENYKATLPRSSYLIDNPDTDECTLGIIGTTEPKSNKYIFGALFMSTYYTVFDQ